jgi:diguanylate cyclase (GGDEF)-like protein
MIELQLTPEPEASAAHGANAQAQQTVEVLARTAGEASAAQEIERLRHELAAAQGKIDSLIAQLEVAGALNTQAGEERPGFMPLETALRRLDEELDRVRRYDKHVGVLLLAIDGWDEIRRRQTSETANNTQRAVGRMISQLMRRSDYAAQQDEGRFLILMPETGPEGARAFGERLCQAVEALQATDDMRCRMLLRASGGLTTGNRETLTRDSLLMQTADALHAAQRAGGGRVVSD